MKKNICSSNLSYYLFLIQHKSWMLSPLNTLWSPHSATNGPPWPNGIPTPSATRTAGTLSTRKLLASTVVTVPWELSKNYSQAWRAFREFPCPQSHTASFLRKWFSSAPFHIHPSPTSQRQAVPLTCPISHNGALAPNVKPYGKRDVWNIGVD